VQAVHTLEQLRRQQPVEVALQPAVILAAALVAMAELAPQAMMVAVAAAQVDILATAALAILPQTLAEVLAQVAVVVEVELPTRQLTDQAVAESGY
jgi:hypothetical protein